MRIDSFHLTKRYLKHLTALSPAKQLKVRETMRLALSDINAPSLRLHELKGEFAGTYSISAGGDLRIHFELLQQDNEFVAVLQSVGTHSQLYG
ncbi:MAG: type II toxin-antitoxin system RelE/ParE family toxin [Propionibacteriaceae bacterium]|nr:type II toxin-antitoxin system RelE/ParE family toxin [Propionibacteriaceae bacterium]